MDKPVSSALIVRKDHLFCTKCFAIEPVHPGDGTPISTFLMALQDAARRHPDKPHEDPFKTNMEGTK